MVTRGEWIEIELSASDMAWADQVAAIRQAESKAKRFKAKGFGSLETHTLGARGEAAMRRYLGLDLVPPDDNMWAAERARGGDIPGWGEVRARGIERYGMGLHDDDVGRFALLLGHAAPVMYLVGWIDAADGRRQGRQRTDNGFTWWLVEKERLTPFPETERYGRRASRWLIDPQSRFWCETCGDMHPIIEHRACRAH